jgi:MFS family permease
MNPTSDTDRSPAVGIPNLERDSPAQAPANWREALFALFVSRIALIECESKDAAKHAARRAILLGALVCCVFFMWALLLAGAIAAIAITSGWPWYWLAIGTGAIHMLAAILLAKAAQAPAKPAFPVTRAEFKKDREWIENLQKTPKSNA